MRKILKFTMPFALAVATALGSLGARAERIVVGQVAPLSGPEASQGRAYAAGMQMAFDAVNKAGGVNGHTFALVSQDDRARPEETVKLTRLLLAEHHPTVLAGYFGSRNIR